MKIILFSLLLCVAGIYATIDEVKYECFANYGFNLTEIVESRMSEAAAVEFVTPYKLGCIIACYLKKEIMNEKTTVVEYIQKTLLSSTPSTISETDRPNYTKIANDCIAEAKGDECEVLKCLKAWNNPFKRLLL